MIAKNVRKIVFGLIYAQLIEATENPSDDECIKIDRLARKIYKKMSSMQIIEMYNTHKTQMIKEYLYKNLNESMFMYWVNGTPQKRDMRLKEYVNYHYNRMTNLEVAAICEKLGLT